MAGCTVQTGQKSLAYFGLAQPLGLVAHLSGDRGWRSANGGASGSPTNSDLPAPGSVEKWCQGGSATWRTHMGRRDREVHTGRTSSMVRCAQPKGNVGGGSVRGLWSAAHDAGRSYSAVRCSGCGRIGRREAGAGYPWQRASSGEERW
jgi:hypothetical protein